MKLLFILAVLIGCTTKLPIPIDKTAQLKTSAIESIQRIVINNAGGHCSSTFVEHNGKVRHITNAHCCQNTVTYNDQVVDIVKKDNILDLCELSHNNMPPIGLILKNEFRLFDDVVAVGFTYILSEDKKHLLGLRKRYSIGNIESIIMNNIVSSAPTYPGMSGGALLSDDGRLVGLTRATFTIDHSNISIPSFIIREFLN